MDNPCSKASVYGFHAAVVAATKKPILGGVFVNLCFFDLVFVDLGLDGLDLADLSLDFDDLDFDGLVLDGLDVTDLELGFDDFCDAMLPSIAVSHCAPRITPAAKPA